MSLPFWNVAHQCNDEGDIADALGDGANGVEFDVMSDGSDFVVRHPDRLPVLKVDVSIDFTSRASTRISSARYGTNRSPGVRRLQGPDFSSAACERLVSAFRAAGFRARAWSSCSQPRASRTRVSSRAFRRPIGAFPNSTKPDPGDCQTP
jgi:hypothetical protein